MKVFLNGTNAMKPNLQNAAQQLSSRGHIVTSSWINEPHVSPFNPPIVIPNGLQATYLAELQMAQIDESDVVVTVLNGFGDTHDRDLRMGYTIGAEIKHILVGDPEGDSLFQRADGLTVYSNLAAALAAIEEHRDEFNFVMEPGPDDFQAIKPEWFGIDTGAGEDQTVTVVLRPDGKGSFTVSQLMPKDDNPSRSPLLDQLARDQRADDDRYYRTAGIVAGNAEGYEAAAADYARSRPGMSVNPGWGERFEQSAHTMNAAQEAQYNADRNGPSRPVGLPDQPAPIPNHHPSAHDLVIQDFQERKALGLARYQSLLQPFNGRSQLIDALQELSDLHVYLRALLYEQTGV